MSREARYVHLVDQAGAEFSERLAASGITFDRDTASFLLVDLLRYTYCIAANIAATDEAEAEAERLFGAVLAYVIPIETAFGLDDVRAAISSMTEERDL